jgi:hypothetical protein
VVVVVVVGVCFLSSFFVVVVAGVLFSKFFCSC